MTRYAVFLALALLGIPCLAAAMDGERPGRVMSLNLCTDQIVLQLLPAQRIASVSFLSRAAERPLFSAESAHVPVNFGTIEEVLAQKPDLVLAGAASTPTAREFLARASIPLVEVPMANSFDEIREVVRLVGRAVGEEAKAQSLIRHMDATLAELAAAPVPRQIVVAGWGGGGEVLGTNTLFDAILTAAGGTNAAKALGDTRFGIFDFEELLAVRPDIIAFTDAAVAQPGLRREQIEHPVVQKFYAGRQISYPEVLYSCGLPQAAEAAKSLRRSILAIVAKGP